LIFAKRCLLYCRPSPDSGSIPGWIYVVHFSSAYKSWTKSPITSLFSPENLDSFNCAFPPSLDILYILQDFHLSPSYVQDCPCSSSFPLGPSHMYLRKKTISIPFFPFFQTIEVPGPISFPRLVQNSPIFFLFQG